MHRFAVLHVALADLHAVAFNLFSIATAVANLVTFPTILYVYEDDNSVAMVKCYNGTDNHTYYNTISDAWWYRQFPNGSRYRITAIEPPAVVFVQSYILTFYPKVRRTDQGQYFCCLPGGKDPGENGCSEPVNISIAGKMLQSTLHLCVKQL